MKITPIRTRWIYLLGLIVTANLFGCTVVYKVPANEVKYLPTKKVDLRVELQLSQELRNAQGVQESMGDTYIIPFGELLILNSKSLATSLFTSVVATEKSSHSRNDEVDATLIPRLVDFQRDRPNKVDDTQRTMIVYEWTLKDKRGKVIWLATIIGEGKGPMKQPLFKDAAYDQIKALMDDLFQKSYRAISSSKEIRDFAKK